MTCLVLIRHGESTWNAEERFTGEVDVPLSRRGREQTRQAARLLSSHGVVIDVCFTSLLIRAIETAVICLTEADGICAGKSPVIRHDPGDPDWRGRDGHEGDPGREVSIFPCRSLNERFYGDLQGLNKHQTAQREGEEIVRQWRRSYSARPPGGESLADTAARTVPFFNNHILGHLNAGHHTLVSAHGNSLRSIVMTLDNLGEREVSDLEIGTAVSIVYEIDQQGRVTGKARLALEE
jgi:2,3-bisphosphoglycerate-dependent phosphoglycerate mutase